MDKLNPTTDAAILIALSRKNYWGGDEYFERAFPKIQANLDKQIQDLSNGNLDQIQAILYSQAVALHDMFINKLMLMDTVKTFDDVETLGYIALKAQNQCRNTLATLADIVRPNKTVFVRQQNNAFNQQINCSNNELPEKNPANELLEVGNGERLDLRTQITPVTVDSSMETMESVNGCENN